MTRSSPLDAEHRRLGAKMIEFGGWMMPLSYQGRGIIAEHTAVRERAGIFDVSHLGKVTVSGDGAEMFLDSMLPGKLPNAPWRAGYNLVLNELGGIVDDIFVYRRPDYFVLVPNAANTDAVIRALEDAAGNHVHIEDYRPMWSILALQGPASKQVMQKLLPDQAGMKLHTFADVELGGHKVQAARTGYTGEFGFEFFTEWDAAPAVWNFLLSEGESVDLSPAGLGARDTLRLEMGYPLHGHEISEEINPLEARLSWAIDWSKEFQAKKVLETIRDVEPNRALIGLVAIGKEIPREGYRVMQGSEAVGVVTSGNFSPVLKRGIAMAYVAPGVSAPGTMLSVEVRGRTLEVEVVKPPFIKRS